MLNNRDEATKPRRKIVFLYAEIAGFLPPLLKHICEEYHAEIHIFHWDKKRLKPYTPPAIPNVTYYARSTFTDAELVEAAVSLNPILVYVSGWMDKTYLKACLRLKQAGTVVVTGFDDKWVGSFRQRIGSCIFPYVYRRYFSKAWVAGPYQYHFARRMGFSDRDILFDLLSADTDLFLNSSDTRWSTNRNRNFLYVGNFREVKGTSILAEAFSIYKKQLNGTWGLHAVGNGPDEGQLRQVEEIRVHPFASQSDLVQIANDCDVFVLPSINDQWGVVVHEFASLGLPLLLSENVGARATLFIRDFNGLEFRNNSPRELALCMKEFENLPTNVLARMGARSEILSKRISVETSTANFISAVDWNNKA